jgi:hypothetical protein
MVFAERVALPGRWHQDAPQMWMSVEGDAEHVPDFALVPVRRGPKVRHGGERGRADGERHFDSNVCVTLVGKQMIDDGEVARWLVLAMDTLTFVDGSEVEEHAIRVRYFFAQIVQDVVCHRACDPECRDPVMCRLRCEGLRSEAFLELRRHGQ